MLVISDSPTFLLEKTCKKELINIEEIIDFSPGCEKHIIKKHDKCLLLLTESFYKNFDLIYLRDKTINQSISETFNIIDKIIERLSNLGIQIYIPLIPRHFIHSDRNSNFFFEKDSKDFLINKLNYRFYETYNNTANIIFLKGIEKINANISKEYFRFSTIYNKENCQKIITQIKEHEKQIKEKNKKLIILDLDNTIWKGTIGDDSIEQINIDLSDPVGAVFRCAQNIFLELKSKGFLLAICSKNNEELALKALFNDKKSLFQVSDIVSYKINWKPKSENIIEICNELNISLKETIFIDDSYYECDEVLNNCEGITIFQVPKNIYKYPIELSTYSLFNLPTQTKEDKNRTKMYKENIERTKIYKNSNKCKNSLDKWIKSLNLKLTIESIFLKNQNHERFIQLFNRTNQFNLSGNKYNNYSFSKALEKSNSSFYYGSTSDRIGNEGIISVIGFEKLEKSILINEYILSCRVFGKYIEEAMLLPLLEYAMDNNYNIIFKFKENKRNNSIKNFINKIEANNHVLNFNKIISLRSEILKLPLEIIDKRSN
tara:strand:+ start:312 stop:1949 length:1638 start_codon:yes stop_codon:yes gene_type:complete